MQPTTGVPKDPLVRHAEEVQQGTLAFLRLIDAACRQSAALLARCQVEYEPRHDPRGLARRV
jgi:hypothetical protein